MNRKTHTFCHRPMQVLTEQNFQINDLQGNDMNSDMTETEDKNTNGDSDMQQQDQQEQQQQREEEEEETDEIIMTEMEEGQSNTQQQTIQMMKLWNCHDMTYRCLEANCSICLLDYQINDSIVQSAANEEAEYCRHVFHYDCMLLWLVQGKKRCPICRHWFVPAIRIKDQQKNVANTLAVSSSTNTNTNTSTSTNTAALTTDANAGAHVQRNSSTSSDGSNGNNANDDNGVVHVAFSPTNTMEHGGEDNNSNNNSHYDNDNDNRNNENQNNDNGNDAAVRTRTPEWIEGDVLA